MGEGIGVGGFGYTHSLGIGAARWLPFFSKYHLVGNLNIHMNLLKSSTRNLELGLFVSVVLSLVRLDFIQGRGFFNWSSVK